MFAAPGAANRLTGTPEQPYLTRAFAAREGLIGLGYVCAAGPSERRRWLLTGLGGDAADAVAALLGWRRGELAPTTAASFVAMAGGSIAIGAVALARGAGATD